MNPVVIAIPLLIAISISACTTSEGDNGHKDGGTRAPKTLHERESAVSRLAYSSALKLLAAVPAVGNVRGPNPGIPIDIWDPVTAARKEILELHRTNIDCIGFTNDGQALVSVAGKEVIVWNPRKGTGEKKAIPVARRPRSYFGDDLLFYWNDDIGVTVWDWKARVVQRVLRLAPDVKLHLDNAGANVCCSKSLLAIGGGPRNESIVIWNYKTGVFVAALRQREVHRLTFSSDGAFLISAGFADGYYGKGVLNVWDTRSWKHVTRIEENRCEFLPVTDIPTRKLLICVTNYRCPNPDELEGDGFLYDTKINAYWLESGKRELSFATSIAGPCVAACVLTDVGQICIGGDDGTLNFFPINMLLRQRPRSQEKGR